MNKITVIGDVHGKLLEYGKIVLENDYTVQVGDLAFDYSLVSTLSRNHRFIKGNHDNYDVFSKNDLGDFGLHKLNNVKFFFIRGAFSIDWQHRVQYELSNETKVFWRDEQLNHQRMESCLKLYKAIKPEIMVSHTCPSCVSKQIGNPNVLKSFGYDPEKFTTNTQELLQSCLEEYQPRTWIFGHFHKYHNLFMGRTNFICLPELGYGDLYEDGSFIYKGK